MCLFETKNQERKHLTHLLMSYRTMLSLTSFGVDSLREPHRFSNGDFEIREGNPKATKAITWGICKGVS